MDILTICCYSHLATRKRLLWWAVFFVALLPMVVINFIASHTHVTDEDRSNARSDTNKQWRVESRFLQHFTKNPSLMNWWRANDSNALLNDDYYLQEQLQDKELQKELHRYEIACTNALSATKNHLSNRTASNDRNLSVPLWQLKLASCKQFKRKHYFLTAALQVRIYGMDRAKWTLREFKQWLHFMYFAGVEHIYMCDHYHLASEQLDKALKKYVNAGLLTYLPWHQIKVPMTAQVTCYQHIIDIFGHNSVWQIAVDMDEYPFMPNDTQEGFLQRYLHTLSFAVSEVSLHNYLMLGHGDRHCNMTIERITRMTPQPANQLDKPVYRPGRVIASIHHNQIKHGRRLEALDHELRLLHYWGSRISDFGPDKPDLFDKTVPYTAMRDSLTHALRASLLSFGEVDAFSTSTGP